MTSSAKSPSVTEFRFKLRSDEWLSPWSAHSLEDEEVKFPTAAHWIAARTAVARGNVGEAQAFTAVETEVLEEHVSGASKAHVVDAFFLKVASNPEILGALLVTGKARIVCAENPAVGEAWEEVRREIQLSWQTG